jgi:hypothetical protein
MSIVKILEEVQSFIDENICAEFTFKVPPSVEDKDTRDYEYQMARPKTFIMYPPLSEKFPSVTIQVDDGETDRNEGSGEVKLRFLFATWSNGKHYSDGGPMFEANTDGWHDAWNFLDRAIDVLSHTTHMGEHVRIKHENKLQFGGMKEEKVLANYYPYWFAWLTCTVEYGQISSNEDVNELI